MRSSSDHKAEAERLIRLARTDEGKLEDDPRDPVIVLQLAQTHALLATVPDDHDLLDAVVAAAPEEPDARGASDLFLTERLTERTLWTAAQWGNLMLIARDTREAVVLTKQQLRALHGILLKTAPTPASHTEALEKATDLVEQWVGGFDA